MNISVNAIDASKAKKTDLIDRVLDINILMNMVRQHLDEAVGVNDHEHLIGVVDDVTSSLRGLDRLFTDVLDQMSRVSVVV